MTDLAVPLSERSRLAVVADQNGVILAQSVGIDQSRVPRGGEILEFRFEGL